MNAETVNLPTSAQPTPAMQPLNSIINETQDEFINIEEIKANQASHATQNAQHPLKKKRGRPPSSKDMKPRKRRTKADNSDAQEPRNAGNTITQA